MHCSKLSLRSFLKTYQLACLAGVALLFSTASFGETINISVDNANPPFMSIKSGVAVGLYPNLLRAIFEKMDKDIVITAAPWKRVIKSIDSGKAGVGGIYKNSKRLKIYDYSNALFDERLVLFTRKGESFNFRSIDDLANRKIGVIRGWSYGDELDAASKAKKINLQVNSSDILNFKKLVAGRVDAVIAIREAGDSLIRSENLEDVIEAVKTPVTVNSTYLAFSKKKNMTAVIDEFNRTVKQMKKDGSFSKIVAGSF